MKNRMIFLLSLVLVFSTSIVFGQTAEIEELGDARSITANGFKRRAVAHPSTTAMASAVAVKPYNDTAFDGAGWLVIRLYQQSGVWTPQICPLNGTPAPSSNHPVWAAAAQMTEANTVVSSGNSAIRYPTPRYFLAGNAPVTVKYNLTGGGSRVNLVQSVLGYDYLFTTTTTGELLMGGVKGVMLTADDHQEGSLFVPISDAELAAGKLNSSTQAMIQGFIAGSNLKKVLGK